MVKIAFKYFGFFLFITISTNCIGIITTPRYRLIRLIGVGGYDSFKAIERIITSPGVDLSSEGHSSDITPLIFACKTAHSEHVIELLIENGANIEERYLGLTPLQYCCKYALPQTVCSELIRKNADIEARDDLGRTPLHLACSSIKSWKHGADITRLLLSYSDSSNWINVMVLISQKADIEARDNDGKTPLHIASCQSEHFKNIRDLLIFKKASIHAQDKNGQTPLHLAGLSNSIAAVRELLKAGSFVNAPDLKGRTVLHLLCNVQHESSISNYLRSFYSNEADITMLQFLLSSGSDIEVQDTEGNTALHLACLNARDDLCRKLISSGAALNSQTKSGKTPLMLAVIKGHSNICIQLLGDLSLKKNQRDFHYGGSATHIACEHDQTKICKMLIEKYKFDPKECAKGMSLLYRASERANADLCEFLLLRGADPNGQNPHGDTPLHCVCRKKKEDIVLLFFRERGFPSDSEFTD